MRLEAQVEDALRAYRRQKQEYLKEHVLNAGYRAEDFHAYIVEQRAGGDEVDNWTGEELESQVVYFQRQQGDGASSEQLHPAGDRAEIFLRRVKTAPVARSALAPEAGRLRVKSAQMKNMGLFRPSAPAFAIELGGAEVVRLQDHFDWLAESLEREFPFAVLPPPPLAPRALDRPALEAVRQRHERFLRDCLAHCVLRHSLSLEVFLTSRTIAEFSEKAKNFSAFLDKAYFLSKSVSRKAFEAGGRELLASLPTVGGEAESKISPVLRDGLATATARVNRYAGPVAKLERLAAEFDRHSAALLGVSAQMSECLREVSRQSAKSSSPQHIAEQGCVELLAQFTEQLGHASARLTQHFQLYLFDPLRHLRDYAGRVASKLRLRDELLAELTSWRRDLAAKLKCLPGGSQPPPLDSRGSREIGAAHVFHEDLAHFQKFAELCGHVNLSAFREAAHFDRYVTTTLIDSVAGLAECCINDALKTHEMLACAKFDAEQVRRAVAAI